MPYLGPGVDNGYRSRFIYTATAGQTSFSGGDANGITLTYTDSEYLDVYQNGVLLVPGDDYAATTGTTVVLVQGASLNDKVEMIQYQAFGVADTVSRADGGAFGGNISTSGTLAVTGIATFTDDIIIGDGKTIGSASDVDAMTISSGGVVTFSQIPVGAFIPEYDIHRITTNTDNTADAYVTANWERCDDAEFEKIGTGLSQSSGIFTFPSTGKYLITAFVTIQARNNTVPQGKTNLYTTTDNSTYVVSAVAEMHGAADQVTTVSMSILFDVTNTTTHKVRLGLITAANAIRALGSSAENRTYITFMKIGAT
tara:strand:+ start:128 stop:1063 length:936 start_codon:yes stop_codon:yes gene_type:complete